MSRPRSQVMAAARLGGRVAARRVRGSLQPVLGLRKPEENGSQAPISGFGHIAAPEGEGEGAGGAAGQAGPGRAEPGVGASRANARLRRGGGSPLALSPALRCERLRNPAAVALPDLGHDHFCRGRLHNRAGRAAQGALGRTSARPQTASPLGELALGHGGRGEEAVLCKL